MKISRRRVLQSGAIAAAVPLFQTTPAAFLVTAARADDAPGGTPWRHALSLFDDIKYPADFKRFDYVNPDAPKGGSVRQLEIGTFDSFNIVVAGLKGNPPGGLGLIYETLMVDSRDEVSTNYGLLAEAATYPDDRSYVIYRLRKEARWHDGKPVTPEDVIFSFDAFKTNSPMYSAYYRHITKVEKVGDRDVKFVFDAPGNRELPTIAGQLVILPKHWWEGTDAQGRKRDVGSTMLEPPLGSGPYRIKDFVAARSLVMERVPDYWGSKLPVNVGLNNFDQIRYEFFRDDTVAREAFKADQVDWILERSAKEWSTAYDFPAVRDGRVIKEKFPVNSVGRMQGFVFNLRRPLFSDVRLRRAFNFAFDFEEMNRQLSTGEYSRDNSYFEGTELASSGLPQGLELQLLEPLRDKIPPEIFTTPYTNPVGGSAEALRSNLREAARLLKEAGFDVRDRKLVDPQGKPVSIEFLSRDQGDERIILFYKPNLERLGITVTVRTVDDVQYQNRLRAFDFDLVTGLWAQSLSPGNEQRDYFGSQSADKPGSRNLAGIKNPAVDALIERIIYAPNRVELVAACKALDRVLLWNFYVVPQFTYGFQRYARWDRFSHPEPMPKYAISGFPTLWWYDEAKAAKIGKRS
ncbi:ABC transporter substrate-binding protein [Bradyrhizobium sp. U87765 SZCCT0131]|uniref:extracellular solute-binding protein n=1 Tax=unclassified Bradyrhizobium TaxID=2631580 RepID=UPI001BAA6217|nr:MULTISPECIES: extracellular solute-binding protein [unclassified Bradyrhizobium]MBR1222119.1 ABC transporter substrate-binding protein [Bradyrhizobium sp. U87765 SZCCT0131]MBR1263683.1 ABC transporter substrate-binding protein [Bradyrhizobium sp. U87765 SZCCT0134]MBR1302747.1 ABC transporter substrate-binding protein [Bradyrhizobium sp. U87765 SZCCT0110]MBR1319933.1 ABC transporter substrate-binding protein [Bradyrhizobium sp. U87765 SZCCT0109]MBR1348954.1 ABC transporter substrate-binding 